MATFNLVVESVSGGIYTPRCRLNTHYLLVALIHAILEDVAFWELRIVFMSVLLKYCTISLTLDDIQLAYSYAKKLRRGRNASF